MQQNRHQDDDDSCQKKPNGGRSANRRTRTVTISLARVCGVSSAPQSREDWTPN